MIFTLFFSVGLAFACLGAALVGSSRSRRQVAIALFICTVGIAQGTFGLYKLSSEGPRCDCPEKTP